jgi:pyruvate formate lyase activating enzyme
MSAGDEVEGLIFDLDTFAVHDGPGIRLAVYLKGCPLTCAWCHSPESQSPRPEVLLLADRCRLCGACAAACPRGLHTVAAGGMTFGGGTGILPVRPTGILPVGPTGVPPVATSGCMAGTAMRSTGETPVPPPVPPLVPPPAHTLDRSRCELCGRCLAACPTRALVLAGRTVRPAEIVQRAVRMKPFFRHSGGGLTLTGGEVTLQPAFAAAVLAGCRAEGIHTAIETCGACDWARLAPLLDHTDLALYDLKLIDDAEHRRWTGSSNAVILANARRLAAGGTPEVELRVPLIPGITDTPANLAGIFAFARQAGIARLALMPYNPAAPAKYEWLARDYPLRAVPHEQSQLAAFLAHARAAGLDARIG